MDWHGKESELHVVPDFYEGVGRKLTMPLVIDEMVSFDAGDQEE